MDVKWQKIFLNILIYRSEIAENQGVSSVEDLRQGMVV
jgi:hypothetical protein